MNTSGIKPIEYNVLVKQDQSEETTSGGIYLPEDTKERNKHSETEATIVAVSPMAFAFDDWPQGEATPAPGDRVVFARHAGTFVDGVDGTQYRVIKDKDVVAVKEVANV